MPDMRFAVVGGGSLGGFLAARLALAGVSVTLVVRRHRAAFMAEHGITLIEPAQTRQVLLPVLCGDDPLPPVDVVVIAVKAHHLATAAEAIAQLARGGAVLVSVLNGLQWWMAEDSGGPLAALDQQGDLVRRFPPASVLATVPYWASSFLELPDRKEHRVARQNGRLVIGPATASGSAATQLGSIRAALQRAGVNPLPTDAIRREIWFKVWPWAAAAPLSVLYGCPFGGLVEDPDRLTVLLRAMAEVEGVARQLGIGFDLGARERLAIMERDGIKPHKPSMLQDFEQGRRLEIDPLVGAVVELGDRVGAEVTVLRGIYHQVLASVESRPPAISA